MQETPTGTGRAASGALAAFRFVLALGIVNLFADMTYEGGASINGPYLATLGAGAAGISIIAGLGEFLGYSLRSVSGYFADKTGKYWLITFIGYGINLLAVPAMALADNWQTAAALVLAERIGRALRKPTIEAMLSYSTGKLGIGWVYALNTALDETGAALGPLVVALVLFLGAGMKAAYGWLLVTSLAALAALTVARLFFPVPARLEEGSVRADRAKGFTRAYWLSMIGGACFGAGLMSFELVSYHLQNARVVAEPYIPVLLSFATVVGIIASLIFGRLYDRASLPVVLIAIVFSALFSPFVFFGGLGMALVGMMLWGIGYATQDTLLKAVVAGMLPEGKRGLAFGLFYTGYGVGWLVGSVIAGVLYEHSLTGLVVFAMAVQLSAVPFFVAAERSKGK